MEQTEVTPYGIQKIIRYMVTNTAEFMEVVYTVNQILGTVQDRHELESLQRSAHFEIISLPHSSDKFVVTFSVPTELLGESACRKTQHLNFGEYHDPKQLPQVIRKPPQLLFHFKVSNLFEINLSLYNFESALAPLIPSAQWQGVKRSVAILISQRPAPDQPLTMVIAAEANPAGPLPGDVRPE
jgi:hypothetical protein